MLKKKIANIVVLVLAMTMVLTSCGKPSDGAPTTSPKETPTETMPQTSATAKPTKFQQSSFLEGKDLPPIEERLPKQPKLINEIDAADMKTYTHEIGKFGGTLRTISNGIDWSAEVFMACNEPLFMSPSVKALDIEENVLKGYEINEDCTEFIFFLREGLKWSDGVAVTMDDFKFTIDNVIFNAELTPIVPQNFKAGNLADGTPMNVTYVDDWTLKISFDKPYGGFLTNLSVAGWNGYTSLLKPAHYLKQFHKNMPEFNQAKVDEISKKNNFADDDQKWINAFNAADITNWELCQKVGIGFPNLQPWALTSVIGDKYVYERNPYYFKVDSEGNQLPYIDKIETEVVQDLEVLTMKYISGEADYAREQVAATNLSMYKEGEEKGNYTTLMTTGLGHDGIYLNHTYEDETWRLVVRDKRFKKALNYAIDKDEIIDAVMNGLSSPPILVDAEFNVEKANKILDEMGMDKRDKDGFRLAPNGKPFNILIEVGAEAPNIVPTAELVSEMWSNIGVKTDFKRIESSLIGQKSAANKLQARTIWCFATGMWYGQDWGQDQWGRAWNIWRTKETEATITKEDGSTEQIKLKGEEPPAEVKEFFDLMGSLMTVSPTEVRATLEKMIASNKENLWFFEPYFGGCAPTIVSKNLGNVPTKMNSLGLNYAIEQFFFK